MKILDPTGSGKQGLYITRNTRFGQVSQDYVIPANPRTPAQVAVRMNLSRASAHWRALQEDQRDAWVAAAQVGDGPRRGFQLFSKINCTLARFGRAQVEAPPPPPQFPLLAPASLVITNTGGAIALSLTCASDPGENTIVRGSWPVSQGRQAWNSFRVLGLCPAPVHGSADITGLYTAVYGVPPVGTKVYVQVNQFVDGWEDPRVSFWAIVPGAS